MSRQIATNVEDDDPTEDYLFVIAWIREDFSEDPSFAAGLIHEALLAGHAIRASRYANFIDLVSRYAFSGPGVRKGHPGIMQEARNTAHKESRLTIARMLLKCVFFQDKKEGVDDGLFAARVRYLDSELAAVVFPEIPLKAREPLIKHITECNMKGIGVSHVHREYSP